MSVVSIPSQNAAGACPAFLQGDFAKTKRGIVVLQEWWGINEQIKEEAKDIGERADAVTIVPDLYRGKLATDNEEAGHLMSNLDWPGAIQDIEGCVKYLMSKGCTKVGVTGFCMGGALTLASAVLVPGISAAAAFYGIPDGKLADVTKIGIPLQCHFGAKDEVAGFSDHKAQEALKEKLEKADVVHEFFQYPEAKHAFTNHKSPNFNKDACDLSFQRLVDFFGKNLK